MTGRKVVYLACVALCILTDIASGAVLRKSNMDPEVLSKANRITIPFVENKGQLEEPHILFYSDTFAGRVSVNNDGSIGYRLADTCREKQHCEIKEIHSSASKIAPTGEQKAVAKANYFKGEDPKNWVTDIPTFNSVNMGEIYPGVSLKLQAHGNNVEKIFAVRPGADPKRIRLNIDGAKALRKTPKGELEVNTGNRSLRFTRPVAYQLIDGIKTPVHVAYTVKGKSYGFKLAAYDTTKELIIDPLITAIFAGTTDAVTRPSCMAADSQGNIYVAGKSAYTAVVFKFDSKLETLLTSAFFGTKHKSEVHAMAIDGQDAVYIAGSTKDESFPVTGGAFDAVIERGPFGATKEGFVLKYNAGLNEIQASTFIGARENDVVFGLAIAPNDDVIVVGETTSPCYTDNLCTPDSDTQPFPSTDGAFDPDYGVGSKTKAFIARFESGLRQLKAATFLGTNGNENGDDDTLDDRAAAVAIDTAGDVVVVGETQSNHFPLTEDCADDAFHGKWEAFAAKFDAGLTDLKASTFLGGANDERVNVLRIGPNNEIVIAGWTLSSDFPVIQSNFDTSYNLYEDGFVSKLNSELTTIEASTFLGGNGAEQVSDMVVYEDGKVLLCGGTGSSNFPVTEETYDGTFNGGHTEDFYKGDGFLTAFDPSLTRCEMSTFLGGHLYDHASAVVIYKEDIVLAGETWSDDFPYVVDNVGNSDAFVCRFNKDEEPNSLPSAGTGHWRSNESGSARSLHLDIDICQDGSFEGIWRIYFCITNLGCSITDDSPPEPVFGTIDLEKGSGTINMPASDCKDIPFVITKQSPDNLRISINPEDKIDDCFGSMGSILGYQGESEIGKCDDEPIGPGGGGGGGGCFIRMTDGRV